MTLASFLNRFQHDTAGAATVDWTLVSTGLLLITVLGLTMSVGSNLFEIAPSIGQDFHEALFEGKGGSD